MERTEMASGKIFNKQIRVSTIFNHIGWYAWGRRKDIADVPNDLLIEEWWYSRLANAYVRYWHLKPHTTQNEQIALDQVGGDNYRIVLQQLLEERGILDEAETATASTLPLSERMPSKSKGAG
jgi:hypothetical protein